MSCPAEYTLTPAGTACTATCPPSFERTKTDSGEFQCRAISDPTIVIPLLPMPLLSQGVTFSVTADTANTATWANTYRDDYKKFTGNVTTAQGKMNNKKQADTLFQKMQDAANGTSPDAYEAARVAYYSFTSGNEWVTKEKNRIAVNEAQPLIDNYKLQYDQLQRLKNQQKSTIDVVNGVKDNLLSVQDDLEFGVKSFGKQIEDIRNQININKHTKESVLPSTVPTTYAGWWDAILNLLMVVASCVAIYSVVMYMLRPPAPPRPIFPPPAFPRPFMSNWL